MTHRVRYVVAGLILLMLPALLPGCGKPRPTFFDRTGPERVWPAPPEPPRIRYVGSLATEEDLGRRRSWGEGIGELIFGKKPLEGLLNPYAVTVAGDGRLLATDTSRNRVSSFNLIDRRYSEFSGPEGGLGKPVGLAVAGDRIYVVDSVQRQVCVYDSRGHFQFAFGSDRLSRPSGVAALPDRDRLYVADTAAHAIAVFTLDGRLQRMLGGRGREPGQFNFPTHLCTDTAGNLYVSDTLNYRIQVFSPDGVFLRAFGVQGDRPGNFAHPCGVAVDTRGHIYVVDRQFENVQIFDAEGNILMALGQEGSEPGEFWLPAGIAVDGDNRIYVADSFNKRVQVFELIEDVAP